MQQLTPQHEWIYTSGLTLHCSRLLCTLLHFERRCCCILHGETASKFSTLQVLVLQHVSTDCCLSAGNKLESTADIAQLQHNSSLVTLDLSNNRIKDEQAVQHISKLPLSLLKLSGNPVVGDMRYSSCVTTCDSAVARKKTLE